MFVALVVAQPVRLHMAFAFRALNFSRDWTQEVRELKLLPVVLLAAFAVARKAVPVFEIHAAPLAQSAVEHHVCDVTHLNLLPLTREAAHDPEG